MILLLFNLTSALNDIKNLLSLTEDSPFGFTMATGLTQLKG